ncbi:MAG: hypothetical protein UIH27_05390, partial [Ruminococcus sp.]|nr:hypothetical protein [Ruminococcus sp.]
ITFPQGRQLLFDLKNYVAAERNVCVITIILTKNNVCLRTRAFSWEKVARHLEQKFKIKRCFPKKLTPNNREPLRWRDGRGY